MSGSGELVRDADCVSCASQVQCTPLVRMVSSAVRCPVDTRVAGVSGGDCTKLETSQKKILVAGRHGFVMVIPPANYLTRGFDFPRCSLEIFVHLFTVSTVKRKG